jgi:hypothetical protein
MRLHEFLWTRLERKEQLAEVLLSGTSQTRTPSSVKIAKDSIGARPFSRLGHKPAGNHSFGSLSKRKHFHS